MNRFEREVLSKATTELWHNPHDDRQFNFKPVRMNSLRGSRREYRSVTGEYQLPDDTRHYVLYELGRVPLNALGIESPLLDWTPLPEVMADNDLLAKTHISGRVLSPSTVYVIKNNYKNVLLAVDAVYNKKNLGLGDLYFRVYSNNWLQQQGQDMGDVVSATSATADDVTSTALLLNRHQNISEGTGFLYLNGVYKSQLKTSDLSSGDGISLLIDKTGTGFIDIPYAPLARYTSVVDATTKAIVQIPTLDGENVLNCVPADELEIYICATKDGVTSGLYYDNNSAAALRPLTHRDFGISVDKVTNLVQGSPAIFSSATVFLRIFRRKHPTPMKGGGDGQYLDDLFRVNQQDRLTLMSTGGFSGWHAPALETCPVSLWQDSDRSHMTLESLKGVYSLNAINTFARTGVLQGGVYKLPYCMALGGKVLCFNADGLLYKIITVAVDSDYKTIDVGHETKSVECIPGTFKESGEDLDRDSEFYGQSGDWNETFFYRDAGGDAWLPAVENVDYTIDVSTGVMTWDATHIHNERMRRSIEDGIYRRVVVEPRYLHEAIPIYKGVQPYSKLRMARTDVFMNGRRCIEGLDYKIKNDNILIYNKEYYFQNEGDVVLDIFHHGVPVDNPHVPEWGYVRHRRMVDTDRSVFFEHRNKSIFVDGARVEFSECGLRENIDSVCGENLREGGVYSAEPWPQILSPWARLKLTTGPANIDEDASAAVAAFIPVVEPSENIYIKHEHALFSRLTKTLILALRKGTINLDLQELNPQYVSAIMDLYADELAGDIALTESNIEMTTIHATPNLDVVEINSKEFMFLRYVSDTYLNSKVVFNTYLRIIED